MSHTFARQLISDANRLIQQSKSSAAVTLLQKSLKQTPEFYQGWLILSKCLYELGDIQASLESNQLAERLDPLQNDFMLIQQSMQKGAISQAKKTAQKMLKTLPGHPRAIFTLAHIEMASQSTGMAIDILQKGLVYCPANTTLRNMLVANLESYGDFSGAIDIANSIVELEESFESLWRFITLLLKLGQHEKLIAACERAFKFCTNRQQHSQVHLAKGQGFRILGQRQAAIDEIKQSIAQNAVNVDAWWALADMKDYVFNDDDLNKIKRLVNTPNIPNQAASVAAFALANAYETKSDWSQAMALYEKANQLHDKKGFVIQRIHKEFESRISKYGQPALNIQANGQDNLPTPIFIVGLPRSGSTLVEQILASHSQIEGTIEQPTLPCIERRARALSQHRFGADVSNGVAQLSAQDLTQLGEAYINCGKLFRNKSTVFYTDKLPFNFRHIGFIHKILPHALIIDVRRNPLDCCLSLYKQYFHSGVEFSYDLDDLGQFYNAYLGLMEYWQNALPGKILTVQYENLVKAPEEEIKKILHHVGVEFEGQCLTFHESRRAVHTASSEQVRKPINSASIGVWQNVENALLPLKESLGEKTLLEYQAHLYR